MLRDYQIEICERVREAFARHRSVMVQMPTGTGKTVVLAEIVREYLKGNLDVNLDLNVDGGRNVLIVAHRMELVEQIQQALKKVIFFENHPPSPSLPLKKGLHRFPLNPLSPQGTGDLTVPVSFQGDTVVGIEAQGVESGEQLTFRGPVILATGHSARDVYRYLAGSGIEVEAKGLAVGVRLEHPSELIDRIQYHNKQGRGKYLPAAEYSFVTQVDQRGVYSFCMCPGGFIIPAATGDRQIVVNGMSPSNRGGQWSNSGMVVELRPEDVEGDGPLKMMDYQERLEADCWQQGNMRQTAPAQRMADFVNGKLSYDLPRSSYAPGLISSPLHFWMPDHVSRRLREGFKFFGSKSRGFLTNEAVVIAVETRTSSPVRILRTPDTLMHVRLRGLFPCGEGAGYAGGIVSAGVDGERCADSCAAYLGNHC